MSRRALLLASLALVLLVLGLAFRSGPGAALALPLLVFLGAERLFPVARPVLEISRTLSSVRVANGTPVTVTIHVSNRAAPVRELHLRDGLPPSLSVVQGSPRFFGSIPAGGETEWSYVVQGNRGEHRWESLYLSAAGPWGARAPEERQEAVSGLLVLPATERLQRIRIEPAQTRGFVGPIAGRRAGGGIAFHGVREYQPGDLPRRINARLSARHTEALFVNDYEQERIADVGVILDAREACYRHGLPAGAFEAAVTAAAALTDTFLSDANRVSLLVYGESLSWVPPGYGRIQRERIRERLARAKTGSSYAFESLDHLPRLMLPARSQLVLVSPLRAGDERGLGMLRSMGYAILLVRPTPAHPRTGGDAADALGRRLARIERAIALTRIRRLGVVVVSWDTRSPLAAAVRQTLSRRLATTRFRGPLR